MIAAVGNRKPAIPGDEEVGKASAVQVVRSFRGLRVLVIGDAMLDTYLEGTASRLCSEGPVPVVQKTAEHRLPGGAGNSAANLRALGATVTFLGVTGGDATGGLLRSVLRERSVDDSHLVVDPRRATLHKLRILADGQYAVRFDEGDRGPCSREAQDALLRRLDEAFPRCDLLVIADYGYGVVSPSLLDRLRTLRAASPRLLVVDSKDLRRFRDVGPTIITPNHLEAQLAGAEGVGTLSFEDGIPLAALAAAGRQLLTTTGSEHVAITLGAAGVFLIDRRGSTRHLPAHAVPNPNVAGAGDSFTAALALALAGGAGVPDAAQIGLDAAGIAVSTPRTSVVSQQDLLQRVSLREHAGGNDGAYRPLAELAALLGMERQAGRTIVFTNGVFDILHAGHVAFLRRAKALGDVLVVGVNSDRSARRLKGRNRPINSEGNRLALVGALDAVDYVVPFDEETPATLIRALRPHVHAKGGDYAGEVLPEAAALDEVGARLEIVPLVGSLSTSALIDRIAQLSALSPSGEQSGRVPATRANRLLT